MFTINKATPGQISRLFYLVLFCAIHQAPLQNCVYRTPKGKMIFGEQLRKYLFKWFRNNKIPQTIKRQLMHGWGAQEIDKILRRKGFRGYEYKHYILNNITSEEASACIEELNERHQKIKDGLQLKEGFAKKRKAFSAQLQVN